VKNIPADCETRKSRFMVFMPYAVAGRQPSDACPGSLQGLRSSHCNNSYLSTREPLKQKTDRDAFIQSISQHHEYNTMPRSTLWPRRSMKMMAAADDDDEDGHDGYHDTSREEDWLPAGTAIAGAHSASRCFR